MLRDFTKYKEFIGKREGGIVNKIKSKDNEEITIEGKKLEKAIINHYKEVHRHPDSNNYQKAKATFPTDINVSKNQVLTALTRFKRDKAMAFDGFGNSFFRLCADCNKTKNDIFGASK